MVAALALAMWWRPGGIRVPWSWPCEPTKRLPSAYTSCNAYTSCSTRRTKLLRQLRTTLLSLTLRGTPGLNSKLLFGYSASRGHCKGPSGQNSKLLIGYSVSHGQVGGCVMWEGVGVSNRTGSEGSVCVHGLLLVWIKAWPTCIYPTSTYIHTCMHTNTS